MGKEMICPKASECTYDTEYCKKLHPHSFNCDSGTPSCPKCIPVSHARLKAGKRDS